VTERACPPKTKLFEIVPRLFTACPQTREGFRKGRKEKSASSFLGANLHVLWSVIRRQLKRDLAREGLCRSESANALHACLNSGHLLSWSDADRFAHIAVQPVSLAAGGLYQPAVPARRARNRRRRPVYHRPRQRPLVARKTRQGPQTHRDPARGFTA